MNHSVSRKCLISVLIVSHNNRNDLQRLLPSLMPALHGISHEILMIDNGSSDDTLAFVSRFYSNVRIVQNSVRMGYGANQNQNIARAQGKYMVLMNPDMEIQDPLLFHKLLDFMAHHPDAGMVTAKVCNPDGTCQFLNKREPALIDLALRRFFPARFHARFKKRLHAYEMRDVGYNRVMDVPFISGSFMFAKTALIRQLGGFDERFFMYFEDVDLTRRLRKKARALYCPDVSIIHRWERASHKSLKWTWVFAVSAMKYYHKWGVKLF